MPSKSPMPALPGAILLSSLMSLAAYAQETPATPFAYWDFEHGEASSAPLTGYGEFRGKLMGSAKIASGGKVGGHALKLDGTPGYFQIAKKIDTTRPWTISAWFKLTEMPGKDMRRSIVESYPNYSVSLGFRTNAANDVTNLQAYYGANGQPGLPIFGNLPIRKEDYVPVWHHVVESFVPPHGDTPGVITAWIDGEKKITVKIPAEKSVPPIDGLYLGTYREASGRWFSGEIDEVALWDRAFDEREAQALHNLGASGLPVMTESPEVPVRTDGVNPWPFVGAGFLLLVLGGVAMFFKIRSAKGRGKLPPPPGHEWR